MHVRRRLRGVRLFGPRRQEDSQDVPHVGRGEGVAKRRDRWIAARNDSRASSDNRSPRCRRTPDQHAQRSHPYAVRRPLRRKAVCGDRPVRALVRACVARRSNGVAPRRGRTCRATRRGIASRLQRRAPLFMKKGRWGRARPGGVAGSGWTGGVVVSSGAHLSIASSAGGLGGMGGSLRWRT
jgi:hypothetical protein